jgi:hypothetical protein
MAFTIDWNTTLLQSHLVLSFQYITEAEGILGNVPFDKPRGNTFAPGLYHICYPGLTNPNYGGIDFPCLIHNGDSNRETIIIVGESPRRNKNVINKNKPCSLGSPYGIIFKEYPDQCWVYKQVFERLLEKGYNLYLTDADKMWTKQPLNGVLPDYIKILATEIGQIEHVIIVTFGIKARNAVRQCLRFKYPNMISHLYHPSQRNYNRWLKIQGVNSIDDIPNIIVNKILNNVDMFKL